MTQPLLEVGNLEVRFSTDEGVVRAVDGASFRLERGKTLGIVGESGCGKSVTALSIMGLVRQPPGRVTGSVRYQGRELLGLAPFEMNRIRGNRIAMIFQEPMTSLNPAFTVGAQIIEGLQRHKAMTAAAARERAIEMLRQVRIPSPERRFDDYPHKLSGGMRQRVMIAMALACDPELLIADEPTTALDVTIQAQILALMQELRASFGMAMILITHDLGVVAETAHDIAVMYAGEIVEQAPVERLFRAPEHPYTVGLLGSIPRLTRRQTRLPAIEGMVPSTKSLPAGCRFAPRCPFVEEQCRRMPPPLRMVADGHATRCWRAPLAQLVA